MARVFPALPEHRLLPAGVHDLTPAEVEALFSSFQRSERRRRLFAKLMEYVDEVKSAGWDARVIVDGSFVIAAVDEPEDIDVILVLPKDWDMASEVRPFEYNLIARKRTRRHYGFRSAQPHHRAFRGSLHLAESHRRPAP